MLFIHLSRSFKLKCCETRFFQLKFDLFITFAVNDALLQSQLLFAALHISTRILERGGSFVSKLFKGDALDLMQAQMALLFDTVEVRPYISLERIYISKILIHCDKTNPICQKEYYQVVV